MSTDHSNIWGVILRGGTGETIIDNASISQLYFIEDIYSWCKVGKLTLLDTQAIWEFLPLVGDEELELHYFTWVTPQEQEERWYKFKIYKVSEITDPSTSSIGTRERKSKQILDIFFVEEEFFKLHMPHFDRTYVDMPYHEILMDMCDRFCGINAWIYNEPAPEEIEFFHTGLKTPADSIRWLFERMSGDWSGESGYLLYSNTEVSDKSWNFVTLEWLLKAARLIDPPGHGMYYVGSAANFHDINTIHNITISNIDKTTIDKLVKCNYLGYDHLRKYQIKREYDYFKAKDRYTILGNKTLFNGDNLMSMVPKPQSFLTGESGDKYMLLECLLDNMYYSDWVKQYCLQQLVSIYVRGHCLRYAGGSIDIHWLSANEPDVFNKQMVGRYLIKSITHQFSTHTKPNYVQKMTLIKNGYYDSDAQLTDASKTNLGNLELSEDHDNVRYPKIGGTGEY